MKAFIERVFKSKKLKEEKENKVSEEATEAMVEALIEEVKKEDVLLKKPKHFPDCTCFKCVRWRNQNAK